MLNNKKKSKAISYMLMLLSFLFLIIVTKWIYYDVQVAWDTLSQAKIELSKKNDDLNKMNKVKASLMNDTEINQTLTKFTTEPSEQDLIEYFFSYSYKPNSGVSIDNMSMEKGSKNETGFMQSNIALAVTFRDEIAMQSFMSFLTSTSSKYSFILQNFSYPFGENNKNFQVNIPLKILYY